MTECRSDRGEAVALNTGKMFVKRDAMDGIFHEKTVFGVQVRRKVTLFDILLKL